MRRDRYVTKDTILHSSGGPAHNFYWNDNDGITASTVVEQDSGPFHTGLLDSQGRPLYRMPERVPLGFHRK